MYDLKQAGSTSSNDIFISCSKSLSKTFQNKLIPPLDIPKSKHFLSLQAEQFPSFLSVISQLSSLRHL